MTKGQYEANIKNVVSKIIELEQSSKTPVENNGYSDQGIFIDNISQQGLLKEIIMAHALGHYVNRNKKQFDAFIVIDRNLNMPSLNINEYSNIVDNSLRNININNIDYSVKQYEYLTSLCMKSSTITRKCKKKINGQMYLSEGNFQYHDLKISAITERVSNYNSTFFGFFDESNPIELVAIIKLNCDQITGLVISKLAKILLSTKGHSNRNYIHRNDSLNNDNHTEQYVSDLITSCVQCQNGCNCNNCSELKRLSNRDDIRDLNFHVSIKLSDVIILNIPPIFTSF